MEGYNAHWYQSSTDDGTGQGRASRTKDSSTIDHALSMLEFSATVGRPFFLQVWSHMTHHPIRPPDFLAHRYADLEVNRSLLGSEVNSKLRECAEALEDPIDGLRRYLAAVYGFDLGVGRLLAKLDELALTDNTVVIFTSDHGAAPVTVSDDLRRCYLMGCSGPFRGGKHDLSEGGVRVPLVVRWPGRVTANAVNSDTTFAFVDFLPTVSVSRAQFSRSCAVWSRSHSLVPSAYLTRRDLRSFWMFVL